ncbi:M18 family aminopeptidase [Miniphocaeibacter massiliensis]|uniref:M18 family aminopeptidase n=1 Tax=Miniphocaeibacter massiliensis TaxID=2041841 RepID=UPI000C07A08A|nr:M18 family aminopeptidase [Miniphocaeibacter massiliensis]
MNNLTDKLMNFIDNSPSVFHVIENFEKSLMSKGYKKLQRDEKWNLEKKGKYYLTNNSSTLIAFQLGSDLENNFFRIIGSHSDSPTFRVKPSPEMFEKKHFVKLNTEVYGSPILSTWFDRPLSLAGRVTLKSNDLFNPESENVNIDKNLLIIPNLAIHMNREINNGYTYNKQKDTLPLIGLINDELEKENYLLNILSEELNVDIEDILDFDLFLYDRQKGEYVGNNNEFYTIGKIDNLGMAHVSMEALLDSDISEFTKVILVSDNEEIGSQTKQGAGSPFLRDTLERIITSTGGNFEDFDIAIDKSFIISSDQAHSVHPNYLEKNDPTNFSLINQGPVVKVSARMNYTSDAYSSAIFANLCKKANVPVQYFVNRSDILGGSTIGPMTTQNLNIKSVDIGNPILSMHSIRELGGVKDQEYIYKVFLEFYK